VRYEADVLVPCTWSFRAEGLDTPAAAHKRHARVHRTSGRGIRRPSASGPEPRDIALPYRRAVGTRLCSSPSVIAPGCAPPPVSSISLVASHSRRLRQDSGDTGVIRSGYG